MISEIPKEVDSILLDETCSHKIAFLLEAMGSEHFAASLRQFIRSVCTFDSMIVTRYPRNSPPVSLYNDLDDVQAAVSVQFYATGPYMLDPLYLACKNGCDPGVFRTLDLVPESFFRSEYYRTFYRNIRVSDEAGLLIRQDDMSWIIVSLALTQRRAMFEPADLKCMQAIFPIVSTAVGKNWGNQGVIDTSKDPLFVEDRFETFGADILSPREAEIIRLVLQGHSTPTAAAYLGISEGTVKVHRHHAYAKLSISSQAELFSMAMRHFISPT